MRIRVLAALCSALAGCYSETTSSLLAARSASGAPPATDVFLEAIAPSASLVVDSDEPGETTGLRLVLLVPTGVREIHELVLTVPAAFGFNGFDALGAGAPIGRWEFDFLDPDGIFDDPANFTIQHLAGGANTAYSDSDDSGTLTATDPTVTHAIGPGGEHVFSFAFPLGGDGDPTSDFSRFDTDVRWTLFDGIAVNPGAPGDYTLSLDATSIDLDTHGASDGTGPDQPLSFSQDVIVSLPEPGSTALGCTALLVVCALARGTTLRAAS